ncbi:hypothetical protein C8A03DRAFT_46505 [Achaetomium macrosporum]|uniref:Uncharacterized protein n=1 Tax=Achaetomium macrosporum TaxID=79813 RepID=A0AAN7C511_9PEZI|nr:hypothetical protein C8A03DRAFT_46505 [Achaetomium macrosporum]
MPEYPGWNLDLRFNYGQPRGDDEVGYPMGIHHNWRDADAHSRMLTVREVAMMLVMDRLTDKVDWHIKVFDDGIAQGWCQEVLAWPKEQLWERISHSEHWEGLRILVRNRWIPIPGPKSPKNILNKESVDYCILELRCKAKDFERTGITPTLDATFSVAKSDVLVPRELRLALREAFARLQTYQASHPDWRPNGGGKAQNLVDPSMYPLEVVGVEDAIDKWAGKSERVPRRLARPPPPPGGMTSGSCSTPRSYWSTSYQWLPANVKFTDSGGVQFTSYINNLHPVKYRDIYSTIEDLIKAVLPMWDRCLGPGRHMPRIIPKDFSDDNPDNWDPRSPKEMLAGEKAEDENKFEDEEQCEVGEELKKRWIKTRYPVLPRPPSYSPRQVSKAVEFGGALRGQFKDTDLQIIVKMVSIALTPENPAGFPGKWQIEGQMNEHIVGTALYYVDLENVTDICLDFRALTCSWERPWDSWDWAKSAYGTSLGPALQNYGSVLAREGRLLAFPNIFQSRVSAFQLADNRKPGHCRFISLSLVHPPTRVISTANVPPQQADWWAESAFGTPDKVPAEKMQFAKLPPEIMDMITSKLRNENLPMSQAEAESHRLGLANARSEFQQRVRAEWESGEYDIDGEWVRDRWSEFPGW